ncbi:unnamed protein product [Rotaria socialis]|uniref:Uncharacterized protein n=1 Tax=Rotaria socialis TaxID=392032 RepID=A0A821XWP0_9BILA|nr:unnamed protein product [Rotaria socialis]
MANTGFSIDRIPPRNLDNFHIGGQASGGIPLIYNGPKSPSLGLGGAISGATGVNGGMGYRQGPDFGLGVGFKYPLSSNGAYLGLGGGTSFGSSYSKPNWGVGAGINIPFRRKK